MTTTVTDKLEEKVTSQAGLGTTPGGNCTGGITCVVGVVVCPGICAIIIFLACYIFSMILIYVYF